MASRIVEVRDAVAARLTAWLAANDPGSATVTTTRRLEIADTQPGGRTVFVLPAGYTQLEPGTRTTDWTDYRVAVVVVERYAAPGDPPDSWADDLSAWVEANVWAVLQVIGTRHPADVDPIDPTPLLATTDEDGLVCYGAEVGLEYDLEALQEHRLFWSELAFTFREDA